MNENTPIRRRRTAGHAGIAAERMNDSKTQSQYEPYKEAAWGFINHWYPALFSEELPEQAISWMSHTDYISEAPEGFTVTAHTENCPVAAMEKANTPTPTSAS